MSDDENKKNENGTSDLKITVKDRTGKGGQIRGVHTGAPIDKGGARGRVISNFSNAPQPLKSQKTGKKVSSGINGLDDPSHHLSSVVNKLKGKSFVAADPYLQRRRRMFWFIGLSAATCFGIAMILNQSFNRVVWGSITGVITKIETFSDFQQSKETKKRKTRRKRLSTALSAKRSQEFAKTSCPNIIATGFGAIQSYKFNIGERLKVARCFLLYDDPKTVEQVLKPIEYKINKLNGGLKGEGKSEEYDALYLLVMSYLRQGKYAKANLLVQRKCRRWEKSHHCNAKLAVLAERGYISSGLDGFSRMVGVNEKLNLMGKGMYWLAGAKLASVAGKKQNADRRFSLAIKTIPDVNIALKKAAYEEYALHLFQWGDYKKMQKIIKSGIKKLVGVGRGGKVKLKLFYQLSLPTKRQSALTKFLSHSEMTYRAKGDLSFLMVMAPVSIRLAKEKLFLPLLKSSRTHFATVYHADKAAIKPIDLWEIRMRIASNEFDYAQKLVTKFEQKYGASVLTDHLRGVCLINHSQHSKYQVLAARHFQNAIRKDKNWESLFGLGVALIRGNRPREVGSIIRELENFASIKGVAFWKDMLKAEWYIAMKKTRNAREILDKWDSSGKDLRNPKLLMKSMFEKMGREEEARQVDLKLDNLSQKVRYFGSTEGFSSPIGPMALSIREML